MKRAVIRDEKDGRVRISVGEHISDQLRKKATVTNRDILDLILLVEENQQKIMKHLGIK